VERRHDVDQTAVLLPLAAQSSDTLGWPEQAEHRGSTQRDDHPRLDQIQLLVEVRNAGRHFIRLGLAVFRRAALDYIAYVDVLALDGNALFLGRSFNHLRE